MEYTGFIYCWTNNINGKKYLGSHKGRVDDGYRGSGTVFNAALQKYGIDNFTREILCYTHSYDDLKYKEQYYLDLFECASSKEYYNVSYSSTGGILGHDPKAAGRKAAITNRVRGHHRKTSERMKATNPNKDGKARREYNKKHGSPNKGYRHTDETKQLLSELKLGDNNPNKDGKARITVTRLVHEVTGDELIYSSLKEAEKAHNANHASVYNNRKANKPYRGYYWYVGA